MYNIYIYIPSLMSVSVYTLLWEIYKAVKLRRSIYIIASRILIQVEENYDLFNRKMCIEHILCSIA